MSAESPIKNQPTSYMEQQQQQNPSNTYALSGRVMLASILTIFIIVFLLLLLHLYARWYLARLHHRNPHTHRPNRHNRSTRIVYYLHNTPPLSSSTGGLDTSVLNSLPLFVYSTDVKMAESECAVCLSEFEEGETGRVLPNCNHSFHTECIDMWFLTHSTCPLCRSPVQPLETEMTTNTTTVQKSGSGSCSDAGTAASLTSPVRPADERTGTSSETNTNTRKRIDVRIDVPNRNESGSENEFRSPGSRLASLKRLISMSRKSPVVSPSAGVGPSSAPVATGSVTGDSCESVQESSRPIVVDR